MSKLKEKLMLSEKGYSDLKKAITACTITNIALLLPSMVACLLFWELLKPFTGETISWAALWKLLGLGLVAAILALHLWPRAFGWLGPAMAVGAVDAARCDCDARGRVRV